MFAEPSMPERRPSPGLSLNLSSNNPFRNRAVSPGLHSPTSPHDNRSSSGSRPMSRNPFLSTFEAEFNKEAKKTDNLIDMSATMKSSPKKATFGTATEDLFKNLSVKDAPTNKSAPPPRPAPNRSATDSRGDAQRQHRPSRSDEDKDRARGDARGPPRPRGPPGSSRPRPSSRERRENRRPRRNSESSIVDKGSLDLEEERRRRQRRRERDERAKEGKSSSQKKVRRPQGLDLIDKLDVSGIYGPSMIHHDGPYDAVQPHRNRKKDARAPMEAFPAGSANNSLGGSGPLNSKIDLDRIHGRGAEGFTDFGSHDVVDLKKPRVEAEYNAKGRCDIVHGEQTHGLGTSTFLEGAPASRKAVQQDMEAQRQLEASGLGRKKSIAQRFRGISQPRRAYGEGRITSPDASYGSASSPNGPRSAGTPSQTKANETNPFFDEYNQAYDSKGAAIKATEANGQSPPRNPLRRSVTAESIGSPTTESKPVGGGFLNRVKSMKGGRRRPA
ncbi:hypothetical protein ACEQ8H_005684 [Pleosporales sp. CAS-2024a]